MAALLLLLLLLLGVLKPPNPPKLPSQLFSTHQQGAPARQQQQWRW
jgi:hypothetical protein